MKGVIFDLDGTLVDSAPDIHAAANALLRSIGCQPLSFETLCSFIGNGIPKLVERLMKASHIDFSAERHADLTETFERLYAEKPTAKTVLYPGVLEALKSLKSAGYALGVCTNKNLGLSVQVLEGLGISGYFISVIGGDSLPQKKPDPAPFFACAKEMGCEGVVYVGDSEVDATTAVAAKVPFLLFTEGYRKSPVKDIPNNAVFETFDQLVPLVELEFSGPSKLDRAS